MLHTIRLFIMLFGIWLALSGHYTPLLIIAGGICALLCALISIRMDFIDQFHPFIKISWKAPIYWLWLTIEIFKSGINVSYLILHPRMPISPCVDKVYTKQKTEIGLVTYANSITLTPGTLTTSLKDNYFEIHALSHTLMEDLKSDEMGNKVCELEQNSRDEL